MTNYKLFFIFISLFASFLISFEPIKYVDEILAVISFFYILSNRKNLLPQEKKIIWCLFLLLFVGLCGTLKCRYQTGAWPIMLDSLGCSKFFLVYILSRHYVLKLSDGTKIATINSINKFIVPFVCIAFVCGVINFFVDIGMTYEERMGFRTFRFIFSDSGHIGFLWYTVLLFLTANYMLKPRRSRLYVIIMGLVVWTLTFKSRAVLFVMLYVIMFYWLIIKNKKLKINPISIGFLVAFSIYITMDQIDRYFLEGNEAMPRTILMTGGLNTLIRFFPIGAGFGTYGTDVAAKFYSNLYYELGYDKMWGLTPEEPIYAHDCYWPAIMGEFGAIGVLLELVIFYYIYKLMSIDFSTNKYAKFFSFFALMTQLFASLPTSVFFQSNTLFFFFLLPLITINVNGSHER